MQNKHLSAEAFGATSGPLSFSKKVTLPLYVYGDETGQTNRFVPSGYMGDVSSLSSITSSYDESAPVSIGRTGHTSLKISYSAKGKQGWAGIYWLTPANNWGMIKGAGFDLRAAKKITFWLRGQKGGEKISQIKVGGVNGPYPDSDSAFMGPIVLEKDWKQYTLDLKGKDLRHIVGGFMFLVRRADNPQGSIFFMDEVVFRGEPADEVKPVAAATPTPAVVETHTVAAPTPAPVAKEVVVPVPVEKKPAVKEVKKEVVAVPTPKPKQMEIYDASTGADSIPIPGRWLKFKKDMASEK